MLLRALSLRPTSQNVPSLAILQVLRACGRRVLGSLSARGSDCFGGEMRAVVALFGVSEHNVEGCLAPSTLLEAQR